MCAREKYILCDSSKLDRNSISPVASLDEITALITDDEADPYYIDKLREAGLEVYVAPVFRAKGAYRDRSI